MSNLFKGAEHNPTSPMVWLSKEWFPTMGRIYQDHAALLRHEDLDPPLKENLPVSSSTFYR